MSKLVLGLDIGIASCGFSLIDEDLKEIKSIGVHCFETAENPKTKESLAKPRREKRLLRRVLRRRVKRIKDIKKLFQENGLLSKEQIKNLDLNLNPWELRSKATRELLTPEELLKILLHIAKRRGFRSSKKDQSNSGGEEGKLLIGTGELEKSFRNSGQPTIGSYLATFDKQRNSNGQYSRTVLRKLHEEEIDYIFDKQRKLGSKICLENLQSEYKKVAFFQNPLRSTSDLVGFCTFENEEKRLAKNAPSAEKFIFWQKLNNLKIENSHNLKRELSLEEKKLFTEHIFTKSKLTYRQIRDILKLEEDQHFNYVRVLSGETLEKEEGKAFFEAKGYHSLRKEAEKVSKDEWLKIKEDFSLLDQIITILTEEQDLEKSEKFLVEIGLSQDLAEQFSQSLSFTGHVSLSRKAILKVLPFLENGELYDKAVSLAGYSINPRFDSDKVQLVPPFEDKRNPVVNRALSQTRKVVNAIIRKYGIPDRIHIEIARDLGKSPKDRNKIQSEQKKNLQNKEEASFHLQEILKRPPTGDEVYRYRLWKEQDERCLYSGKYIKPQLLGDGTALEIDHAIPYSRKPSDSWNNKVLVFADENRKKGNKTPFEYLGHDEERWNSFIAATKNMSFEKRRQIAVKNFSEEQAGEWLNRNLNDTRYIAREVVNHLKQYLAFPVQDGLNVRVRPGQLTAFLRWQWGLTKNRAEDDRHHALDATIVACADESIAQRIAHFSRRKENGEKEIYNTRARFELPWDNFREQVIAEVSNIFVSRLPRRSHTGSAHEDTIRSLRNRPDGSQVVVQRKRIETVKLSDLENLWDKQRNLKLYEVLKKRLQEFNDKPEKAFSEPTYMPAKTGQGPRINSIVVETNEKSGVFVGGAGKKGKGFASNGNIIRADVFYKDKKFFIVPVYVSDQAKGKLPDRAILANKPKEEWPIIDETYEFKFSLYTNDYVVVRSGKEQVEGYFRGVHSGDGRVKILHHYSGKLDDVKFIGSKTLLKFEKYKVDYFGNKYKVKKELRNELENRRNNKECKTSS